MSNGGGRFIAGGFDAEDDHGRRRKGSGNLEGVHGTDDAHRPFVEHVRVDHGRFDVGMSEQRLHGADVLSGLEKVRRKAVPEAVRGEADREPSLAHSRLDGALDPLLVEMMPSDMTAAGIGRMAVCGKDILPPPFIRGVGVFPG